MMGSKKQTETKQKKKHKCETQYTHIRGRYTCTHTRTQTRTTHTQLTYSTQIWIYTQHQETSTTIPSRGGYKHVRLVYCKKEQRNQTLETRETSCKCRCPSRYIVHDTILFRVSTLHQVLQNNVVTNSVHNCLTLPFVLLERLQEAMKVNGHAYVCQGYSTKFLLDFGTILTMWNFLLITTDIGSKRMAVYIYTSEN